MDEIRFVVELGERLESSIERSVRRRRRPRPLVGVVAFASTILVIGAVSMIVHFSSSSETTATQPGSAQSSPSSTVVDIPISQVLSSLPTPSAMEPVDSSRGESPGGAPTDLGTRKFRGVVASDATSITVNIVEVQPEETQGLLEGSQVRIGDLDVLVSTTGELTSVVWKSAHGFIVQIVARGPVATEDVLSYAGAVHQALEESIGTGLADAGS